jgi:hypothetical protein
MKTWVPFNVNDTVRIKVTAEGRKAIRERTDDLNNFLRARGVEPQNLLKPRDLQEDADGWSEWQMWDVMSTLGEGMKLGAKCTFETNIQIQIDSTPAASSPKPSQPE